VNGFKDQFNCHKFTVKDIIQRIRACPTKWRPRLYVMRLS